MKSTRYFGFAVILLLLPLFMAPECDTPIGSNAQPLAASTDPNDQAARDSAAVFATTRAESDSQTALSVFVSGDRIGGMAKIEQAIGARPDLASYRFQKAAMLVASGRDAEARTTLAEAKGKQAGDAGDTHAAWAKAVSALRQRTTAPEEQARLTAVLCRELDYANRKLGEQYNLKTAGC